jgi:hypothetical protein
MTYNDLREVRAHYVTLRDLVIQRTGGWDDVDARTRVEGLCGEAIAALEDAEARQWLRLVREQANALFSRAEHLKWGRSNMTGADYLRLQMLIALESLHSRLLQLEAERNRPTPARSVLVAGHAS